MTCPHCDTLDDKICDEHRGNKFTAHITVPITDELVERVARAIYDTNRTLVTGMVDGHFVSNHMMDWDDCKKYNLDAKGECTEAANAALKAIYGGGE